MWYCPVVVSSLSIILWETAKCLSLTTKCWSFPLLPPARSAGGAFTCFKATAGDASGLQRGISHIDTDWWFQSLWKIWKSVGIIIPNIWKNKNWSKPPTRICVCICFSCIQISMGRKHATDHLQRATCIYIYMYIHIYIYIRPLFVDLFVCSCSFSCILCMLRVCLHTSSARTAPRRKFQTE